MSGTGGAVAVTNGPYGKGAYVIVLRNGRRLIPSRYYLRQLKALLSG
jgi:hypothetical protein